MFIYVVPKFTNRYDETYTCEYGTLDVGFDCRCLVVRDERLHTSEEAGTVDRHVSEGKAMRRNSKIVSVGDTAYYSQVRGVVAYSYDGLENNLTPEAMDNITKDFMDAANSTMMVTEVKKEVESGDVIFKIVNNQEWYLITWLDEQTAKTCKVGRSVRAQFGDEDVKMEVYSKSEPDRNGEVKVILSCNRIYKGYLTNRVMDCRVITQSKSGILIETDSIVVEGKQGGVMRVDKYGNANFVPVKILLQDNENTTCVEVLENEYFVDDDGNAVYTLKNYDTILKQKKDKKEGSE